MILAWEWQAVGMGVLLLFYAPAFFSFLLHASTRHYFVVVFCTAIAAFWVWFLLGVFSGEGIDGEGWQAIFFATASWGIISASIGLPFAIYRWIQAQ